MGVMGVIIPLSSTTPHQNGGLLITNNLLMSGHSSSSSSSSSSSLLTLKNQYNNSSCHHHQMRRRTGATTLVVHAKSSTEASNEEEPEKKRKQNLFESVTEALDFAQVRSVEDAQLLDEAREATKSGSKMSREQYGALRRKIGGTYKDFFKSYIEVEGPYVEEGWVDKTCKVCKKDTSTEPRQKDYLGRYVHVACLDNKKSGGNFFTKLFS